MRRLLLVTFCLMIASTAHAASITYNFVQTGAFRNFVGGQSTDFGVSGQIVMDLDEAFDPLFCNAFLASVGATQDPRCTQSSFIPMDFGSVQSLIISYPFFGSCCTALTPSRFPYSDVDYRSPFDLFWSDGVHSTMIRMNGGVITFSSDGALTAECGFAGNCVATGQWVPTPEPSTLLLIGTSLACAALRRRHGTSQ
jgi:hypothetical protein